MQPCKSDLLPLHTQHLSNIFAHILKKTISFFGSFTTSCMFAPLCDFRGWYIVGEGQKTASLHNHAVLAALHLHPVTLHQQTTPPPA